MEWRMRHWKNPTEVYKSSLTSVARMALRLLQNGVRNKKVRKKYTGRSNPTGKSNWAFERNEEKSRKYTERSNPKGKRNLAFERKEGNVKGAFEPSVQRSKIPRLGQWEFAWAFEPSVERSNSMKNFCLSVRTLCAAFEDTESWKMGFCLSVRTLCGAFEPSGKLYWAFERWVTRQFERSNYRRKVWEIALSVRTQVKEGFWEFER